MPRLTSLLLYSPVQRHPGCTFTYGLDCSLPSIEITLSSCKIGSAINNPVTYWDEILPGRQNVPPVSFPVKCFGFLPSTVQPCWARQSRNGPMGLSGNLPRQMKSLSIPRAPASGSRNRSVDPLSPHGTSQQCAGSLLCTFRASPMFRKHSFVAEISSERPSQRSVRSSPARNAAINILWAADLDTMAFTMPPLGAFVIFISLI